MTVAQDEIVKKLVASGVTAIFAHKTTQSSRLHTYLLSDLPVLAKHTRQAKKVIPRKDLIFFEDNDVMALALKLPTEADPLYRIQVMGVDFAHNCHAAKIGDVIADMMHMINGTEPPPMSWEN